MKETIAIACGGTGGHINPAMAVAERLREMGHPMALILSGKREAEVKTATTWEGALLKSGMCALSAMRNPLVALANLRAFWRCYRFLKRQRPAVLFTTGGYTCFPAVVMARFLHIPVVFHEANSLAGAAIRFCVKHFHIEAVATSFKETAPQLPNVRTVLTGLPLRKNVLAHLSNVEKRDERFFTVLITGGSQGAHGMNVLVAPLLISLAKADPKVRIVHQCGTYDYETLTKSYADVAEQVTLTPFIEDMGKAYQSADIVIARAGAATCFELARCAVPTIFIPLPTAADDHQRKNAEAFARCGGAICLDQNRTTPEQFADVLRTLYHDADLRQQMREAFLKMPQSDATQAVTALVLEYLRSAP